MDTTSHGDTPGSHDCCALPPPAGGRDQHQCRGNTLFYSYTCCTACYCRGQTNISVEVTPCFTVTPVVLPVTAGDRDQHQCRGNTLLYSYTCCTACYCRGAETNISVEVTPCFTVHMLYYLLLQGTETNISVEVTPCFTVHMLYYLLLQGTETNISVEVTPCFTVTHVVLPVTAGSRDQHQCRGNTLLYTCCTACYCRGQKKNTCTCCKV